MEIVTSVVLCASALALVYASMSRLFYPRKAVFLKGLSQKSDGMLDINLRNEIRAIGAVLILGAIVIVFGVFLEEVRNPSMIVSTLIFTGIALGRGFSAVVDGIPSAEIIQIIIAESIISGLNIWCLIYALL